VTNQSTQQHKASCSLSAIAELLVLKTKQFTAMVSIDDLQEVVHGLFKEPITGLQKSQMAEIRHLETIFSDMSTMTSSFFCRGRSDLDEISQTGAE